ncbi:HAD family phosphatase [Bacteroides sp. 214]|uniref:HAD family hydrolase n=1 Tax=Bacteroides sp. 214 TaxID=2302935 RepID=UPI0013D7C5A6|nr:HAD family phosphatase [Bacteroides sp. 214]NDW12849.1 HAD family phosphatase [Bacteroides sp. 214]
MKKGEIKNLIFDFGGVLIDLHKEHCIEKFRALGVTDAERLIGTFSQQGVFKKLECGQISTVDFRNEIRRMSQTVLTDEQIDDAWNNLLGEVPTYKLDALLELRQKYAVYLLSNTNAIHWDWSCKNVFTYKGHQVTDYFDEIFLSYEMKQAKPDVAIFKMVIEKTAVVPHETLFIDDSLENCKAADSLGMVTYNVKPNDSWLHILNNIELEK